LPSGGRVSSAPLGGFSHHRYLTAALKERAAPPLFGLLFVVNTDTEEVPAVTELPAVNVAVQRLAPTAIEQVPVAGVPVAVGGSPFMTNWQVAGVVCTGPGV
jgi:hypothetical protein